VPHEFEVREEITLDATPAQVWEAIATGPGIDSWFLGHNEVEPGEGGTVRWTMPGMPEPIPSTITAWEPGRHFAYRGAPNPDGTFMAFEYLIQGRDDGSTVLRFVHNGFLGDDWETEYDALKKGDRMYLQKLAIYVKHFPGRTATYTMFAPGPQVPDEAASWSAFQRAFGVSGTVREGDKAQLSVEGLPAEEGVVEIAREPDFLGVRTADGLHVLIHGYDGTVVAEYAGFGAGDGKAIEAGWQSWLASLA
jgi:uncharacterized protein YndB with AHSA1/START domain